CLYKHFYAVSCSGDFLPLKNMYVIELKIITYPIRLNTSGPSPKNVKLKIVVKITVEYVKIEISRAGAYLYESVIPNCYTVEDTIKNNKNQKNTRLNSIHVDIIVAVICLMKRLKTQI